MTLNTHLSKAELNEPYLAKSERLVRTKQTGDAKAASSEAFAGVTKRLYPVVPPVPSAYPDPMASGNALNWTTKPSKSALITGSTNHSRRNNIVMAFEKTKKEFHDLSHKRSEKLRQIKQCENDIVSITERLETLGAKDDGTQDFVDQFSKAKDKRRRLRDEVADLEHEVRMTESEIKALMMEYQFVVDLEDDA
tara:strand:- start:359 stop:940 length:582 start_codon:yes stop_codon:yes gene_type:complete